MTRKEDDTWQEWSKHVLLELKRLNATGADTETALAELATQTQANTQNLHEHMRRTDDAERKTALLITLVQDNKAALDRDIAPLKVFIDRAKFLAAVLVFAGGLVLAIHELGIFARIFPIN